MRKSMIETKPKRQDGLFDFCIPITRAWRSDAGDYFLEGVASSPALDSYQTRFSLECQRYFVKQILDSKDNLNIPSDQIDEDAFVKAEMEHYGEMAPIFDLGIVDDAKLDGESCYVRMRLDEKNPIAVYYWTAIDDPDPKKGRAKKLGLSINGMVEEWHSEYDQEAGKTIKIFDKLRLERIGIVKYPSNPTCYVEAISRSVSKINKQMELEDKLNKISKRNLLDQLKNKFSKF